MKRDKYDALVNLVAKQTPEAEDAPEVVYNLIGIATSLCAAYTQDTVGTRNIMVKCLNMHLKRIAKINVEMTKKKI